MNNIFIFLFIVFFAERIAKHVMVLLFFRRVKPFALTHVCRVSIIQPILSGDPTLFDGLDHNLRHKSKHSLEFIWLLDVDDSHAWDGCQSLIKKYPEKCIKIIKIDSTGEKQNPKTVKLIAGSMEAKGDVICVLDDDTRLPDYGLDLCLPYLDMPGAGLAFGLPYYVSFANFWSSLVAYFVNSHSLMNYVPYSMLADPFTINGMFYLIRRKIFDKVGGFYGLEFILADDFAVAQRIRDHGYRLIQTPLLHGISTWVTDWHSYFNLIKRWFIFPQGSIMRKLHGIEKLRFNVFVLLPTLFPLVTLVMVLINLEYLRIALIFYVYEYLIFAHFNLKFFNQVSPWNRSFWVIFIQLLLPVQVLLAFLLPQKIIWRGHVMQVESEGGFKFLTRRGSKDSE